MSDTPLRIELNNLERKLILLLNDFNKKKQEVEILKAENSNLKSQLSDREEQLDSFQNKDKISKLASSMVVDEGDTEALSNLLNEYINEVDKCIAHLSE